MKRFLAAVLLVGLVVTGCGGSSSKKAGSTPTPALPTGLPTGLPTDLPTGLPSSLTGLASAECQQVAMKYSQASSAFSTTNASTPLSDRFAAVSEALTLAAEKIDKTDVKAAFQTLAKAYGNLARSLKGVDYTPGSGSPPPAAYLSAARSVGTPEFAAAARVLGNYFAGGCK